MKVPFEKMHEMYARYSKDLAGNRVLARETSENIEAYVWGKPGRAFGRFRVVIDRAVGTVVMTGDFGNLGMLFNSGFLWDEFRPGKHAEHIPWDRAVEKASRFHRFPYGTGFPHVSEVVALAIAMHEIGSELGKYGKTLRDLGMGGLR